MRSDPGQPLDAKVCESERKTRFDGFAQCELTQLLSSPDEAPAEAFPSATIVG